VSLYGTALSLYETELSLCWGAYIVVHVALPEKGISPEGVDGLLALAEEEGPVVHLSL